jgi:hypothetical protein
MIELEPFKREHLENFQLQEGQLATTDPLTPSLGEDLEGSEVAVTIFSNKVVVGCVGLIEVNSHRCVCWSMFVEGLQDIFITICRGINNYLNLGSYNRYESVVDVNFKNGARFMKVLGFKREGLMKSYYINGGDAYLYAKVGSN